nr:hypothetical protein L203_04613 [Cryptococcus depauperatus CBS 7841]
MTEHTREQLPLWQDEPGADRAQRRWHTLAASGTGDEPGVDVQSQRDEQTYGHLRGESRIEVVDYAPSVGGMNWTVALDGDRLQDWLESPHGRRPLGDDGKPLGVRWLHVDGVNWDVVKALTVRYGLHPLAVEDALEAAEAPRSKLDFYKDHLYLQLLIHRPGGRDERSELGGHADASSQHHTPRGSEKQAHKWTVDQLSAEYMVPVQRSILSVFMLRDGTLLSMDVEPLGDVLAPIYARLQDRHSLLRRSGDVGLLAQAMLDTAADLAVEVSQQFESAILKLEASVLVDPDMETVRHLHILSSQLIRLRRALKPLLHVCYVVRDQDVQRSVAASAVARSEPVEDQLAPRDDRQSVLSLLALSSHATPLVAAQAATLGFFSPLTKVYVEDVIDHLEMVTGSLEQFAATCDRLTDYVFNVLSFQTNASMERLSIVTVVFLPLTFIASYFGMNFTQFAQIEGPVSYFWKVAVPCTVAFFLVFSFGYIRFFAVTATRKLARWKRARDVNVH